MDILITDNPSGAVARCVLVRGLPTPSDSLVAPGLHEGERAVLRLFGSRALHEVYELGRRCERDSEFAAQVRTIGSVTNDPDGWAKLAGIMPDYLIAEHTARTFLGDAVSHDYYRAIPTGGAELLQTARHLQRFVNERELQHAVSIERELSLVPTHEPIWSRYSPTVFEDFFVCQRDAYQARLSIQPGGREILESLSQESEYSRKLSRVIVATLIESVPLLSARDYDLIRVLGRQHTAKNWIPITYEQLGGRLVTQLTSTDGAVFSPPQALVDTVARLHHQAWGDARTLVAAAPEASQSFKAARQGNVDVPAWLLKQNFEALAALTFINGFGRLLDRRFEAFTGQPAEALNMHLPTHEAPQADTSLKPSTAQRIEISARTGASSLGSREVEHPQNIKVVGLIQSEVRRELLTTDRAELQPVFTALDHAPGSIDDPGFRLVVAHLRELHASHRALTQAYSLGLLSLDGESLSSVASTPLLHTTISFADIFQILSPEEQSVIRSLELKRRELKAELCGQFDANTIPHQPLTKLVDQNAIEAEMPAIQRLIESHVHRDYWSEEYMNQGGLLENTLTSRALRQHLADDGSILIRRKASGDSQDLDGMFIYGKPGHYPQPVAELLEAIAPNRDLSFATLFMTATDRAKGTYMSLMRGMAARLALEGARYSLGTVGERNHKHYDILLHFNHRPLNAAALSLKAFSARFIPMVWELP